ncbi:MAG TPA: hypothetical protein VF529_21975 [Solirubrobacteraceae bacterium]
MSVIVPVPVPGTVPGAGGPGGGTTEPPGGGLPGGGADGAPGATARLTVATLLALPSTRRCVRRLRFTIRRGFRSRIASVAVKVGRRKARVFRGPALRRPLRVAKLPRGRFGVRITVKLKDGRKVAATRRHRRCR